MSDCLSSLGPKHFSSELIIIELGLWHFPVSYRFAFFASAADWNLEDGSGGSEVKEGELVSGRPPV